MIIPLIQSNKQEFFWIITPLKKKKRKNHMYKMIPTD